MKSKPPFVSVCVTVRNAASLIPPLIVALDTQTGSIDFEIVVSYDRSSTDATGDVLRSLQNEFSRLVVVECQRAGIAAGRNDAFAASKGEIVLTCDADDRPAETWLSSMVAGINEGYDVCAGAILFMQGGLENPTPKLNHSPYAFLPFGLTANLAYRRQVHLKLGGFSEELAAGEDVDFTWRAQEQGFTLTSADAIVWKTQRRSASERFRQHLQYGKSDVILFERHRAFGMRRESLRAAKTVCWLLLNSVVAPTSGERKRRWMGVAGHQVGRLVASAQRRTWYP